MGGMDWGRLGKDAMTGGLAEFTQKDPFGVGGAGGSGGGGKKGGGAPSPPDFNAAADKQAASSQQVTNQQTQANRPNQSNAFGGSSQWTKDANGNWTQNTSLGGPLGDAAHSLEGQAAANAGTPLDNGSAARDQAINATYGQASSRLDPQWKQREEATRSQLAAQGLDPGSEAFNTEMGNFGRDRNDAYGSAMNNAISTGNQAQALTFGENLAARQEPLNELGQLRGFTEMPGFNAAGAAQPAQYLPGAIAQYGGALQGYSTDQAGKNSKMQGAAGLGAAGIAASDERLKTHIVRSALEAVPGVPFASWEWKDGSGPGFGVIAQDVEKVRPDCVLFRDDGMRLVNYDRLLGREVNHG